MMDLEELDHTRPLLDAPAAVELRDAMEPPTRVLGLSIPSRIMPRSSTSTCDPGDNANLCEKPVSTSTLSLPIALGVV